MAATRPNDLESLQVQPLRSQVYNQIKSRILMNYLRPGQQIVIDQIVKQFGVSHTPVREALGMLEADGLVTIERYKTVRVTNITAADVRDVYELRILLEGWAIAEATLKLSEATLAELTDQLSQTQEAVRDGCYDSFLEADLALHNTIIETVENHLYSRILQLIGNHSTRIRTLVEATRPVETMQVIMEEHCLILQAMQTRDIQLAQQHLENHLQSAMQRTLSALEEITHLG